VPGSYKDVNYRIRPAKSVQRKMLCEAFQRLSEFGSLKSYRYVGLPATFFSDFILLHRVLGIHNMVGIEVDPLEKKRFEFNLPFRCIKMRYGHSNAILPQLDWDLRTILWLDYDDPLSTSVLTDVGFFFAEAPAGSVMVVTLDARPDPDQDEADEETDEPRLTRLNKKVGEENVPRDVREQDLADWGTAFTYHRIVTDAIRRTVIERNGSRPLPNQLVYEQLFYFCYADGPKMVTVGGLLYERSQGKPLDRCGFKDLDFIRSGPRNGSKPCFIEVPSLTFREIRHLDSQLPRDKGKRLRAPRVPVTDLKRYERIYRYFPAFAEAEL